MLLVNFFNIFFVSCTSCLSQYLQNKIILRIMTYYVLYYEMRDLRLISRYWWRSKEYRIYGVKVASSRLDKDFYGLEPQLSYIVVDFILCYAKRGTSSVHQRQFEVSFASVTNSMRSIYSRSYQGCSFTGGQREVSLRKPLLRGNVRLCLGYDCHQPGYSNSSRRKITIL